MQDMSPTRRRLGMALTTLGAGVMLPSLGVPTARAQSTSAAWPSRPITVVVGYPPGGSTDLTGRIVADGLAQVLGSSVVVENVGGAGGAIGAQKVVNAAPDGHTILVGANNEIAINRLISSAVKYSYRDFTPIGLVASQPLMLVASPKAGVRTPDEFLRKVKANPGKFSYGSSGVGTALHLAGEMIKQQGGLFMTHIPYRGVAPLTSDLMGEVIEYGVYVLSSGLPHVKSGKLVAIGTTERRRSAVSPDIPALAETAALRNTDIGAWFAVMAPAKLPAPIAERLKAALAQALTLPDIRKRLQDAGSTIAPPDVDMAKFLVDEAAKYQKIVDFANIRE